MTKTPTSWRGAAIPACFESRDRPTSKRLWLRLANAEDRSRWEFTFTVFCTPKMMQVSCFVLGWNDESMTFPKTIAVAQEHIRQRESYSANSGFDGHFRHESGLRVLAALLNELAEQLASTRTQAVGK